MQQYAFGGRNPPGHAGGADSAPLDSLAGCRGAPSARRKRKEGGR